MARFIPVNSAVQVQRRIFFHLVQPDGITPALSEVGGQPQISTDGGAWTNTGISVLSAVGNGRYYADLTQAAIASPCNIETRYKSGGTAEIPGDSAQVGVNPYDTAQFGLSVWPTHFSSMVIDSGTGGITVSPTGLNDIPVTDPGGTVNMTNLPTMIVGMWRRDYRQTTLTAAAITMYKDDGTTVNTTQPVSDNGIIQVQGNASP